MKKIYLSLLLVAQTVLAQQHTKKELTAAYLNSEKAMREDEYATSLKRRNWLNNRLIFSAGAGSKYAMWGSEFAFFSLGVGVDYITPFTFLGGNPGVFASFGFVPSKKDPQPSKPDWESFTGWRVGMSYTFLPKTGLHPGIAISYGTAYYDYLKETNNRLDVLGPDGRPTGEKKLDVNPDGSINQIPNTEVLTVPGINLEGTLTYMTGSWYFFQLNVGASYTEKQGVGENTSIDTDSGISLVIGSDKGIEPWNFVVGAGVGFALKDFNPDITEIRYRQRQAKRRKLGLL